MEKKELKPLTSLRFVAALGVFFYHLPDFSTGIYNIYIPKGYAGVNFFFVLSGFVLAYNYHDRLGGPSAVKDFYIARFARIYPLHLLTYCLVLPLFFYSGFMTNRLNFSVKSLANLSLMHAWFPSEKIYFSLNMPSWTISVEFFFYAMFPLLMTFRNRLARRAPFLMGSLLLAMLFASFALSNIFTKDMGYWALTVFPLMRLVEFVCGILLFYSFTSKEPRGGKVYFTLLETAALAFAALSLAMIPALPPLYNDGIYFVPAALAIVYVFAFQKGIFSSLLSHPAGVLLGEISFAFYMFHHIVIKYMEGLPWLKDLPQIYAGSAVLAVTLFLSFMSFFLFESPMRKKLKRTLSH